MSVEQYLNTKAELAGKKLASHPVAVERREIRKAATQARYAQVAAGKAQKRQERAFRQATTHPWLDRSLPEAERYRLKYALCPEFRLKELVRRQLTKAVKRSEVGDKIRLALKRNGNAPSVERLVGYSIAQLRVHIERQFTKGMSWQVFTTGRIHIDHIMPVSSFDLTIEDEFKACWALTNLRPLWSVDNLKKSGKRTHLL